MAYFYLQNKFIKALLIFVTVISAHGFMRYLSDWENDRPTCTHTHQEPWDYFMLVMQWPQAQCEIANVTGQHECVIPPVVKGWTIHGLWPSGESKDYPFCCHLWHFDVNKIQDLLPNLEKYWPNVYADTEDDSFWRHEYEKHGTCAASVAGFEDEHSYFQQTLTLRSLYTPMTVLEKNGITPSTDPYKLSDIVNVIDSAYGVKTCVECGYIKESQTQLLSGLYVCLTKDLQLKNCTDCEHACYDDEDVYYHPLHM
ncbi:ribonuclease Oy-like [Hydractinia symbiolongicarpus]|uniref:ribonuclease Oy-like n=1 Tax=Hydractinia symbiolongicarpus TaxID=13093 RepID=UPI00254E9811|nr:ribonuclease Oy-like [Hydractinia symbiolongicarpus]XP_057316692.1 ribonuclease Oy-like [Hydractinia symbiolongicarpus]